MTPKYPLLYLGIFFASLLYQPLAAQTATATVNTAPAVNTPVSPTVETIDIVENGKSGIKVLMPSANPSVVNKNWKKFLKNCKGKTNLNKEGYFTDNASIPKISENAIDIYSEIDKYPEGTILKVFFDLGGAYLNKTTHAEQHKAATQMLHDFGANESIAALKTRLVVEEKKMLAIRDERKRLKDNNDKILKQIAAAKEAVTRSELMLRENQGLQEKQDQEAQIQINKVEQLKTNIGNISLQK
ncbi:MAG: hypothetical protein KA168_08855 [Chitinophagales bacterium]|jgi:hypothetical protein|nr:hypothetical protein [Chitinophagales bacterium]